MHHQYLLRTGWLAAALLVGLSSATQALPRLEPPTQGAYSGAFVEFGLSEDQVSLEKIENFVNLAGKPPALVIFANHWGAQRFPQQQLRIIDRTGATPLILWYPWERPPEESSGQIYTLDQIIHGQWDAYLDQWGQEAKAFGRPLLVSWGLEMNGDWYPWSGVHHNGASLATSIRPGPPKYREAYRHVVDRVRATGADNISWVFHVNNLSVPNETWNSMAAYYPGSAYVDWLGMSAYGKQYPGREWVSVKEAITSHYQELAAVDPDKPILLAEWGVGEFPKEGSKAAWISEAMTQMKQLPRLKGAVIWHERWQNDNLEYSNLRIHSSMEALNSYRERIAEPFWVDRPQRQETRP